MAKGQVSLYLICLWGRWESDCTKRYIRDAKLETLPNITYHIDNSVEDMLVESASIVEGNVVAYDHQADDSDIDSES